MQTRDSNPLCDLPYNLISSKYNRWLSLTSQSFAAYPLFVWRNRCDIGIKYSTDIEENRRLTTYLPKKFPNYVYPHLQEQHYFKLVAIVFQYCMEMAITPHIFGVFHTMINILISTESYALRKSNQVM